MEGLFKFFHLENIHPVIVHFPVAFSILYTVLELIPFKKFRDNLFITKVILVFLATISILAARETGQVASLAYKDEKILKVVAIHKTFSLLDLLIFSLITILYLLMIFKKIKIPYIIFGVLALAGLITISITGALGGSIAWGANNDPFTNFTYHLFFK